QRLVRKICAECRESVPVAPEVAKEIEASLANFPAGSVPDAIRAKLALAHGRGCPKCGGTGYRGRTIVTEVLEFSNELQQLIVRGFPADEAAAFAKQQGMLTFRQDALLKALEGLTTYEEVLRITHE
ncbi:type II secretion system protein GspE, partial [Candidatus Uhrbacteria bacterium]|nr:type II secretion system protein GspE [Candidatus Uhrbacteria bacterium]